MPRQDFFGDAAAPAAALVVPKVFVAVTDKRRRVLIHQRPNGSWSLPGGAVEPGETLARTAIRETREEVGVTVTDVSITAVVTDPSHVIVTDELGPHQQVAIVATARVAAGRPGTSTEARRAGFVEVDVALRKLDPAQRSLLDAALRQGLARDSVE